MKTLKKDPQATDTSPAPLPESFIPLRHSELSRALAERSPLDSELAAWGRFHRLLAAVIHARLHGVLAQLKEQYAPFDPDADTREPNPPGEAGLDARRGELFATFEQLLLRGNFHRLAETEIDAAVEECSHWGLHLAVNFEIFDRLALYCRGDRIGTRYRRRLSTGFKVEAVDVPIYQRLVVIFRLRPTRRYAKMLDTHDVYVKLFKDIPKPDLDMLLPGTNVRMSLLDRARIMLPTLSGITMAVVKIMLVGFASLYTSLAFLGLVGGTLGYGMRSLFGYFNTKQKYQLNLTQSLYYQNIDNNAGVIHRLVDEAEEQENREALLAYYFLWREAPPEGWSAEQLDAAVERYLQGALEHPIDFEVRDALDKLSSLRLARQENERWIAEPIERAVAALERAWGALGAA